MTDSSKGYPVGYKKPPKSGQFKKGQSGNPRGRPKSGRLTRRLTHVNNQLDYMMLSEMTFEEKGKTKSLPFVMWLIKRMQHDALKGNRFAQRELLAWFRANLMARHKEKDEIATTLMNQGYWNSEMAARFMVEIE